MDHTGHEAVVTAESGRSHTPVLFERPKRNLKPTSSPTLLQAEQSEEMQRHRSKRGRKPKKSDPPAVDTASVPTKGLSVLLDYLFVYFLVNYRLNA